MATIQATPWLCCLLLLACARLASCRWFGADQGQAVPSLPEHPAGSCRITNTQYVAGRLEAEWSNRVNQYQQETDYCTRMASSTQRQQQDRTLARVQSVLDGSLTVRQQAPPSSPPLLSQITYTVQCGKDVYSTTEVIEPLYAILRHPFSMSCPDLKPTNYMMNMSYAIIGSKWSVTARYAPKAFYFDVGASTWPELSQSWMLESYERRGITFDRIFLWEATPMNGTHIHSRVPDRFYPAYQYFNIPASPDPADRRNPLNILKGVAKPEDFVAFKLDIDAYKVGPAGQARDCTQPPPIPPP